MVVTYDAWKTTPPADESPVVCCPVCTGDGDEPCSDECARILIRERREDRGIEEREAAE